MWPGHVYIWRTHQTALTPQGRIKNIETSTEAAVETIVALLSPINKQVLPEWPISPTAHSH